MPSCQSYFKLHYTGLLPVAASAVTINATSPSDGERQSWQQEKDGTSESEFRLAASLAQCHPLTFLRDAWHGKGDDRVTLANDSPSIEAGHG